MNEHGGLTNEQAAQLEYARAYRVLIEKGIPTEKAKQMLDAGAKVQKEKSTINAPNIPKTQKGQVIVGRAFRNDDSYDGLKHTIPDDDSRNNRKEAHVIAEDSTPRIQIGESFKATKVHVHPKGDHTTGHFTPVDGNRHSKLGRSQLKEERRKTKTLKDQRRNSHKTDLEQDKEESGPGLIRRFFTALTQRRAVTQAEFDEAHAKAKAVKQIKRDPNAQRDFAKAFSAGGKKDQQPTKESKAKGTQATQGADVLVQSNSVTGKKTYRRPDGSTYTIR